MKLEQRIARLEAKAKEVSDSGNVILLSPYDAALLIIERANLADSTESAIRGNRIDALLESHSRAVSYSCPKPMAPEEAAAAMAKAEERDEDQGAADKYRRERLATLMPEEYGPVNT